MTIVGRPTGPGVRHGPGTVPLPKLTVSYVYKVLEPWINNTQRHYIVTQGSSDRFVTVKDPTSCDVPDGSERVLLIGYDTSAVLDDYGLPIEGGPQPGDDIQTMDTTPGNSVVLGVPGPGRTGLPYISGVTSGPGIAQEPYGTYTYNGIPAPGQPDKHVKRPKVKIKKGAISGLAFDGDQALVVQLDPDPGQFDKSGLSLESDGLGVSVAATKPALARSSDDRGDGMQVLVDGKSIVVNDDGNLEAKIGGASQLLKAGDAICITGDPPIINVEVAKKDGDADAGLCTQGGDDGKGLKINLMSQTGGGAPMLAAPDYVPLVYRAAWRDGLAAYLDGQPPDGTLSSAEPDTWDDAWYRAGHEYGLVAGATDSINVDYMPGSATGGLPPIGSSLASAAGGSGSGSGSGSRGSGSSGSCAPAACTGLDKGSGLQIVSNTLQAYLDPAGGIHFQGDGDQLGIALAAPSGLTLTGDALAVNPCAVSALSVSCDGSGDGLMVLTDNTTIFINAANRLEVIQVGTVTNPLGCTPSSPPDTPPGTPPPVPGGTPITPGVGTPNPGYLCDGTTKGAAEGSFTYTPLSQTGGAALVGTAVDPAWDFKTNGNTSGGTVVAAGWQQTQSPWNTEDGVWIQYRVKLFPWDIQRAYLYNEDFEGWGFGFSSASLSSNLWYALYGLEADYTPSTGTLQWIFHNETSGGTALPSALQYGVECYVAFYQDAQFCGGGGQHVYIGPLSGQGRVFHEVAFNATPGAYGGTSAVWAWQADNIPIMDAGGTAGSGTAHGDATTKVAHISEVFHANCIPYSLTIYGFYGHPGWTYANGTVTQGPGAAPPPEHLAAAPLRDSATPTDCGTYVNGPLQITSCDPSGAAINIYPCNGGNPAPPGTTPVASISNAGAITGTTLAVSGSATIGGVPVATNPMTTAGDLIIGGTVTGGVATPTTLAPGTDGQVLEMVSGAPAWATLTIPAATTVNGLSGAVTLAATGGASIAHSGQIITITAMANPMNAAGDLIVGGSAGAAARLGAGSSNQVLTIVAGAPAWATLGGGGGGGTTITAVTSLNGESGDLSILAGAGIAVTAAAPNITIANTGVTSLAGSTGILASGSTGDIILTLGQVTDTSSPLNVDGDLHVIGGNVWVDALPVPSAPTSATAVTGTALSVGTYDYALTYTTLLGETTLSATKSITTTSGNQAGQIVVPALSVAAARLPWTGRRLYRRFAGGTWYHIADIGGAGGATVNDTTSDGVASGFGVAPSVNTTGGIIEGYLADPGGGSNGQVLTRVAGAPAWATPAAGYTDPLTTTGDLVYRSSSATTRLGIGSAGQVLTVSGGLPAWVTPAAGYTDPLSVAGDILYRSSTATTRLPVGTDGQVLTLASGLPAWATPASGTTIAVSGQTALTGAVVLAAGNNVTLTESGQTITIAAATVGGSGGGLADATTTLVGGVLIDTAPASGHPVAITQAGIASVVAMQKIAEYRVGLDGNASTSGTITFTSIPQTYRHLRVVISGRSNGTSLFGTGASFLFNNDTTSANYTRYRVGGENGTFFNQNLGPPMTFGVCATASNTTGMVGTGDAIIFNYTNTTFYKAIQSTAVLNANNYDSWIWSGSWLSTSAITRVDVVPAGTDLFVTGTIVSLYGWS